MIVTVIGHKVISYCDGKVVYPDNKCFFCISSMMTMTFTFSSFLMYIYHSSLSNGHKCQGT